MAEMTKIENPLDASRWASEWCRVAREISALDDGRVAIDEGWMIGWFANAMMAMSDARGREIDALRAERDALARVYEALVAVVRAHRDCRIDGVPHHCANCGLTLDALLAHPLPADTTTEGQ